MLIKNQIYTAQIVDYTSEGQGVAKIEGCAVFVPNAIAGENSGEIPPPHQPGLPRGEALRRLRLPPHGL